MRNKFLTGVMAMLVCITSFGAAREIDYAVEDAAVKTIQELTERNIDVSNIAFVGLAGDKGDLGTIFRSGLLRVPGSYNFFTRDDSEFNVLLSEIEFGDRRGDVMDQSTIKSFGKIKGVDALLYGKLLEATVEGDEGIVRVTLTLADVETGQLLWSGNITGKYTKPTPRDNIDRKIIEATIDAGKLIAAKISNKKNQVKTDIFLLPLVGKMSGELTDILTTELISNCTNNLLSFYSEPSAVNVNSVRNLSYKLAGEGTNGVSQVQLGKLLTQLEQIYDVPDSDKGDGITAKKSIKAYLIGNIVNVTEASKGNPAKVIVTYKLRKCSNNQLITGGTVTGSSNPESLTTDEEMMNLWKDSGLTIKLIAGAILVVIIGVVFFVVLRMMTAVR